MAIKCLSKTFKTELADKKEIHDITVKHLEAKIDVLKYQHGNLEHKRNDKEHQNIKSIEFQVEQHMLEQTW